MHEDLNDLAYFAAVVEHDGFSAAARATGIEKTRLSRRVASLEKRLGVRLLLRTTRRIALTEAGQRFHEHCHATLERARAAYESVEALRTEPAGTVRISCPQVMAQSYLAPILAGFLAAHPKVNIVLEATDRDVDLVAERFDIALRASSDGLIADSLVVRKLATARQILVASPAFLNRHGRPTSPDGVSQLHTLCRPADVHDDQCRWTLTGPGSEAVVVAHIARLQSNDLRVLLEAAVQGIGIAMLPEPIVAGPLREGLVESVLPAMSGPDHLIELLYHRPRGRLPSVRSLIGYLVAHLPVTQWRRTHASHTGEPSTGRGYAAHR
ncbi:LysR substrate-binding domain-containing protein [Cupriavidus plantarum]|uniref:LysR substrate-binding domain-containing protein n=1 Tax=Cupriavidus plantarum TaxID=942865 RepID=UPI0015CD0E72|nr:LysR substrate-binding domain-containing protein [Cupriavidus plantarum]NYI00175.1 DNA-binding transcriptional LysR family regulator [Cupriavidus plantarum]